MASDIAKQIAKQLFNDRYSNSNGFLLTVEILTDSIDRGIEQAVERFSVREQERIEKLKESSHYYFLEFNNQYKLTTAANQEISDLKQRNKDLLKIAKSANQVLRSIYEFGHADQEHLDALDGLLADVNLYEE